MSTDLVKGLPKRGGVPILLSVLLLAVALLYWQGLHGQLIFDDLPNLKPFEDLSSGAIRWQDVAFKNDSGALGRPITMLTLVADFYIGDGRVFQFKLTNLLLHLINGGLLFLLANALFAQRIDDKAKRQYLALLVAALWLTAPLLASTVLYVIQRMAQLAALFSLLGMLAYAYGRVRLDSQRNRGIVFVLVAYLLAWPAAILSKENGVLLPAFLLLMEFYWYGFEGRRNTVLFLRGLHFVFCIVPFFVALVWIAMHIDSLRATYSSRNFSLGERLLTETRVMWDYVRQLFLPRGIEMGITHDDFEISRGLFRPIATIAAVLAWAGVLFSIIRWRRNATFGPLAFGMAFFIVGHILECTVFPLELYFEHRNYLPSMGLFLGAVLTAAAALQQFRNLARLAPLVVLLPVATGFITYQRVITWQSPEAIARMAEYAHPNSSRLQTALISMYVRDGKLDKTRAAIARLQEIDGGRSVVHALLELESDCHLEHKPLEEEYKAIISTTRFSGDIVSLHTRVEALANLLVGRGCKAVDMKPLAEWFNILADHAKAVDDWKLLLNTARILFATGDIPGAIALLDRADALDRTRLEPWLIKVQLLMTQGDFTLAQKCLLDLEGPERRPVKYQTEMIAKLEADVAEKLQKH